MGGVWPTIPIHETVMMFVLSPALHAIKAAGTGKNAVVGPSYLFHFKHLLKDFVFWSFLFFPI